MFPVGAIFVPFPTKTGTNLLHPPPPPPIVELVVIKNKSRYSPLEQQISASTLRVLGVRQIVALGALDRCKCVLQTDESCKSPIVAGIGGS